MQLGDLLLEQGLVQPEDIDRARQHQREQGGRLGDCLIALGVVTAEQLDAAIHTKPTAPKSLEATGISLGNLIKLLIKTIYARNLETPSQMEDGLKLANTLITQLLDECLNRKLLQVLGASTEGAGGETRYDLSQEGRKLAAELLADNQYIGPVPVSLDAYHERIHRQRITNERIDEATIRASFSDIVVPEDFVRALGPGINSGRCILLYGPPGNGKTTVAEKVGRIFSDTVYIPYAVEVDGQIIKVFDPSIHESTPKPERQNGRPSVILEDVDRRWVPCRRPIIMAGGELTLEMLDLKFNSFSKFYEAPLHLKALGGTFIIDDFGRQIVSPEELLNRWIVPLQSRIDYLKLHTGKSFSVPFDELVIFSTNLAPADLMDPAFLRRIPYKLRTDEPSIDDYRSIFDAVAKNQDLELTDEIFHHVLGWLREGDHPLACYQPKFIVDQVVSACKYEGRPSAFSRELVTSALSNLYVRKDSDCGPTAAKPASKSKAKAAA